MSQRLKELREKMATIATNAQAKLSEIKDDTPDDRAAEIETEFDAMMADHDKIAATHDREKRAADALARIEGAADERRPTGDNASTGAVDDGEAPSYRSAFHEYIAASGNQGMMSPEARAVLQSGYETIAAKTGEQRAQVTTTGAAGGFTVPEEMMPMIVRSMAAWGPMYDDDICMTLNTNTGVAMPFPTVNDTENEAEKAPAEGVTLTDDGGKDVIFDEKQLESYAFDTEWIRVSLQLATDSPFAMETLIGELLGERLGRKANRALTVGTGTNQPHGIMTASGEGKVAASATAITWDEIIDLEHSVDPAYRASPRCRYMFNDKTLQAVRKLKDGDGNYLWQKGDVQAGTPAMFNGRAYSINQAIDEMAADKRVMLFGDLSKYFVRKVGAPLIGAISDKDFWPGFGVAGYIRFDGEIADAGAIKHLKTAA